MSKLIRAAGAVVYSYDPSGQRMFLLIHDRHHAWTLPKGRLEPDEDETAAAIREIAEETGVVCELERLLIRVAYPVYRKGIWRDKEVAYFLARAALTRPVPASDEGITQAAWIVAAHALRLVTYAQVRQVVRLALKSLDEDRNDA
ncbi:MAG: NUDIX domain-containing protein [Candidatus Viridilinea halotolerans]|uniref:NUDIX domain-containing protein n=1 Tax=Candidatus Viridilinea halotolerans TaxID=2491704 RepID=A0A426UB51_9CHLR|nr:MAG: NUDIX domain-containing protein [Candidatus Viridilinea halotolerans]